MNDVIRTAEGVKALSVLEPAYDAVAIHVIAERRNSQLHNLYTSVLHGRASEMYTVPASAELVTYSNGQWICFRQLVEDLGDTLVASLGQADLQIGHESIHYELGAPILGFRAQHLDRGPTLETSPLPGVSMWAYEYAATGQVAGALTLSARTLPAIVRDLSFLRELRWRAVDLTRRPERLGALDIWYPSPVQLSLRNAPLTISVTDHLSFASGKDLVIRVRLYVDGLEIGTLQLSGPGPYEVAADVDAIDAELRLDGVVLDRCEAGFLRGINFSMAASTGKQKLQMSKPGKRAGATVPIAPRQMTTTTIGSRRTTPSNPSRALGHLWRDQQEYPDSTAERLFDPRDPNSVAKALGDFQTLKGAGTATNILVVDRYSLNHAALEAIIAIAVAHPAGVTVDIVTKFDEEPAANSSADQRIAAFSAIAKSVSEQFGIRIRLHKIDGIDVHDRFLAIDERIWHIGPSFNAIGEALSGLVEMRDLTGKAALLDMIDPFTKSPVFDSRLF